MSSVRTLIRQIFLVLLEYCSFSNSVLQYQYQGFSIVLQYKTARLVQPCKVALYQQVHVITTLNHLTVQMYKGEPTMMISDGMQGDAEYNRTSTVIKMDNPE